MISRLIIIITVSLFFASTYSQAANNQEKRVMDATDIIDQILRIPEQ